MPGPAGGDPQPSVDVLSHSRWDDEPFSQTATSAPAESALRGAILRAVLYADLFDFPLTGAEIQQYLIGEATAASSVDAALAGDVTLRRHIQRTGECYHLAGRNHLAEVRRQRADASAQLWPVARHYAARIAQLPFVRLVGVTGALAMNNARPGDDIDLFILAEPGRLWLCRLLVLVAVKLAARRGHRLCPNFLLSTDHLRLSQRNLFAAHEVVQMVPLEPDRWYGAFIEANGWVRDFLPNALPGAAPTDRPRRRMSWPARVAGAILSTPLLDPIERWEMRRKIRRLTVRLEREGGSVAFSAHECRGHFAAHDARVLAAYRARLAQYGLPNRPLPSGRGRGGCRRLGFPSLEGGAGEGAAD
jgi:hypothetical protein